MKGETLNKGEVIKSFWRHVNTDRKLLRQKNKKDFLGHHTSDIRDEFANYIEQLRSNGSISNELANEVTL